MRNHQFEIVYNWKSHILIVESSWISFKNSFVIVLEAQLQRNDKKLDFNYIIPSVNFWISLPKSVRKKVISVRFIIEN